MCMGRGGGSGGWEFENASVLKVWWLVRVQLYSLDGGKQKKGR
jgi:hypothetical protein